MSASVTHYRWDDMPKEQVSAQLARRLVTGDRLMLAHVYLDKGCLVPRHHHENEQLTYILSGALRFRIGPNGEQEIVVRAGEVLHIPSNVPHEAEALEDTLDVDVFSPPRADWLAGTDAYLRDAAAGSAADGAGASRAVGTAGPGGDAGDAGVAGAR